MTVQLHQLFGLQSDLMRALGMPEGYSTTEYETFLFLQVASSYVREAAEVLDAIATATKPWKQGKNEGKLLDDIAEEIVDGFFFQMEMFHMLGLTHEKFVSIYLSKLIKNCERILSAESSTDDMRLRAGVLREKARAYLYSVEFANRAENEGDK